MDSPLYKSTFLKRRLQRKYTEDCWRQTAIDGAVKLQFVGADRVETIAGM